MSFDIAAKNKRLRRVVLMLLCTNHDQQKSRFDSIALWSALVRGLSFDCSQNELVTILQDLKGRAMLTFSSAKTHALAKSRSV
ncbi:hypothetical protein ACFQBQ_07645 [Granulicella cerasi]|uniref:Uncharacterized protein n=1 Tax=Granulicella cerasi TaxID=741063 RepID=A0ABW1Z799_9BACT|nr:hypothetical protein [Granulicella cerasi]